MSDNTVTREELLSACNGADWSQVIANGGPPCFHLMQEGDLCLRAERWPGHPIDHSFVSIQTFAARMLDKLDAETERCAKIADRFREERDCAEDIAAEIRSEK